jgi:PAS domain S-box-containing protein
MEDSLPIKLAKDILRLNETELQNGEIPESLAAILAKTIEKRVADELKAKEKSYQEQLTALQFETAEFYQHSPVGYFSTAANGLITKVNDTLLAWLGYQQEEIINKVTWQSLLSIGGKMYFETHYSPLLQMQGFVQEISFEMIKKDKNRLPVLINTKQLRDENGKVKINYSTVFDVSHRKAYEKELLIAKKMQKNKIKGLQS